MFATNAYAMAGGAEQQAGGSGMEGIVMLVIMFAIFYFLLIRPQQKRAKEHKNMVADLSKGDEVVTMGGLLGKVTDVEDNLLTVEIAKDTQIRVQRMSVQAMMPKGTY